jgi:TonB family protein
MARNRKRLPPPKRNLRAPAIAAAVVLLLAVGVFILSQNIAGVSRPSAPPAPTVNLLPPPPPPPPPPPTPPKPPPPENKPMEAPKPADQPKPDNAPKNLTIAGPAQAGSDAFGVGAGSGGGGVVGGTGNGGTGGGGFEEGAYSRVIRQALQEAVKANHQILKAFKADVAIWISPDGRVTHVRMRRSTGDTELDKQLLDTFAHMRAMRQPPPPQYAFPREVQVTGERG